MEPVGDCIVWKFHSDESGFPQFIDGFSRACRSQTHISYIFSENAEAYELKSGQLQTLQ